MGHVGEELAEEAQALALVLVRRPGHLHPTLIPEHASPPSGVPALYPPTLAVRAYA